MNLIRISNVAAQIDPSSVTLVSQTAADQIAVREQNYQYDLINPDNILKRMLGKRVKVGELTGTLLSDPAGGGGIVLQTDKEVVLRPEGLITVSELPAGLISRPRLLWRLRTDQPMELPYTLAYMTRGLSWQATYDLVLNESESGGALSGMVTLTNDSGKTFREAKLKVVGGQANRATGPPKVFVRELHEVEDADRYGGYGGYLGRMAEAAAPVGSQGPRDEPGPFRPEFVQEAFFEYHLYDLQRPTTLQDREQKQILFLDLDTIRGRKRYVYDPIDDPICHEPGWWRVASGAYYGNVNYKGRTFDTSPQKVDVFLKFKNSEELGLGEPLPAGKVRVRKYGADGRVQFVGEDEIDHTPVDEEFEVQIDRAFDVTVEAKTTGFQVINTRHIKATRELRLRNHKRQNAIIECYEHFDGASWKLTGQVYRQEDAWTTVMPLGVGPGLERVVRYTIEVWW